MGCQSEASDVRPNERKGSWATIMCCGVTDEHEGIPLRDYEPVFGRNLEQVSPRTSPRIPEFVMASVTEIEKSEKNKCTDGLYRVSGNLNQVLNVRLQINQRNLSVVKNIPDIHVLTGSLKLFFRELKEPLIPCNMFDRVLAACLITPREARTQEFKDIVNALPPCNRDTLKYLLEHLIRVSQYSESNRMHTANLAIVFGPTLLWARRTELRDFPVDYIQQNKVIHILLTDFNDIFADDSGGWDEESLMQRESDLWTHGELEVMLDSFKDSALSVEAL